MNRRNAIKLIGAGAAALAVAPVQAVEKKMSFADWMRHNVPVDRNPRILVMGRPKSGKTMLVTMLFMQYASGLCYFSPHGKFEAAKKGYKAVDFSERNTANRTEDHSGLMEHADVVLYVKRRENGLFFVSVCKNRFGWQGTTFNITDEVVQGHYAITAQRMLRQDWPLVVDKRAYMAKFGPPDEATKATIDRTP